MNDTPETDKKCPYCKAMPMGMVAKVRWTCGSYGGPTGRSEHCKERASAWDQRDAALRERDEAREVASGLAIQEERVNEAQKELSSIHQWIERNHPDGFIDSLTYFENLDRITENWYDRLDRLEVDANRFEKERDEAREQIKELIYIGERAIALAEIDFENDKFGVVSELRDGVERIKEGAK